MLVILLDDTSDFIDHMTTLLMYLGTCVLVALIIWMVILYLLSRYRYPPSSSKEDRIELSSERSDELRW